MEIYLTIITFYDDDYKQRHGSSDIVEVEAFRTLEQAQQYVIDQYSKFIDERMDDLDEDQIDWDFKRIKAIITKNLFNEEGDDEFQELKRYMEGEYVERAIDHELKKVTI